MRPSIYLVLFALLAANYAAGAPAVRNASETNAVGPNTKKDVFISRGWGAGGMPFSVLYMTPLASKAPVVTAQELRHPEPRPKALPQVRTAQHGPVTTHRKQYSIIPQLFVSHGWGPLGK